jgi:hypothetical protein
VKEDTNGHEHKQKEPGRYRKIQNIGRSREDKESSGIGDTESSGMKTTERFVEDTRKPGGDTGRLGRDRGDTEWKMQGDPR